MLFSNQSTPAQQIQFKMHIFNFPLSFAPTLALRSLIIIKLIAQLSSGFILENRK
jgi:hypothetical protein